MLNSDSRKRSAVGRIACDFGAAMFRPRNRPPTIRISGPVCVYRGDAGADSPPPVTPGLTCLWQVMGRNKLTFEEWMRLDLAYIDGWSLWMDFKLCLKTVPVILFGTGAK